MLSPAELEAIRGRADGATDGPWGITDVNSELAIHPDGWCHRICATPVGEPGNATFIAHARTDVPALLDTIADARTGLGKHFDDIDRDCEGNPNDLDWMVELAGGQLSSAISHRERETERANVAEHKNSQLRSRFALELAARTTPDMAELQRQANRIIELEDVGKDNQCIVETLARALRVDLGAHCITELVHAAADMIEKLKSINGGLRSWQDVARPELEARVGELERLLAKERAHKLGTPPPSYEKDPS